jgi:hypothetical protein
VVVFNEQELELISNEFTYNNVRRLNRNYERTGDSDIPFDCFTAQELDSQENILLKNISTKSIILAPFNSTRTHFSTSDFCDSSEDIFRKGIKMKFDARVREIDRQYERNNNCELDNGVYNKVNKEEEGEPQLKGEDPVPDCGLGNYEDDVFEKDNNKEDCVNIAPPVETNPESQRRLNFDQAVLSTHRSVYTFVIGKQCLFYILDYDMVQKVERFGYPSDYIVESLNSNEVNYCTATYYLLCTDQIF